MFVRYLSAALSVFLFATDAGAADAQLKNGAQFKPNNQNADLQGNVAILQSLLQTNANGDLVIVNGSASITLKRSGDITISGKNISITGSGKVTTKSAR